MDRSSTRRQMDLNLPATRPRADSAMKRSAFRLLAFTIMTSPAVAASPDWLVDPSSFKAVVKEDPTRRTWSSPTAWQVG